ncbi:hypothetical protein [Gemmatimonas sp.]|jgi:hypothetical protein|uniref:hypothetical protein n=1 Tax=Gemmatimonas sp. TaxID=1962908 RepID=UPI0037BF221E
MFDDRWAADTDRRSTYVCFELVLRRMQAAVQTGADVGGMIASDRLVRICISCSCETTRIGPWSTFAEPIRHELRLRAARCVGACDLTTDRVLAFQPCLALNAEVTALEAQLRVWAEETTDTEPPDHSSAKDWWTRRRGRGPLQPPRDRRRHGRA